MHRLKAVEELPDSLCLQSCSLHAFILVGITRDLKEQQQFLTAAATASAQKFPQGLPPQAEPGIIAQMKRLMMGRKIRGKGRNNWSQLDAKPVVPG